MNEREIAAGLAPTPGYRYAQRVGNRLFVAGQVPLDSNNQLVGDGNVPEQAAACLRNLGLLLAVHGFESAHVRQITIHVVGDQSDLAEAWDATVAWFGGEVPPATLLGAAALGYPGQLVEVDAVIVADEGGR